MARKQSTVREHTRRVPTAWKDVTVSEHGRSGAEGSGGGGSGSGETSSTPATTRSSGGGGGSKVSLPSGGEGAQGTIVGCAIVVAAVWGFRTLYETGKEVKTSKSSTAKELAGLSDHPAHPAQFLLGFGFVFFTLSVVSMSSPKLAKTFAILVATGTTLANGASMFTDIGNAEAEATNTHGQATTSLVTANPVKTGENQKVRSKA